MKLKTAIGIEVKNIKVADGYYSFDYLIIRDGKKTKGKYDSDYDGQTAEHFKKVLEGGYALELVLERVI